MENNRNYFVAIALSVLVVMAWQFFYMGPKLAEQQRQEEARQVELQKSQANQPAGATSTTTTTTTATSASPNGSVPGATDVVETALSREAALAKSPRVAIDTPS